MSETTDLPPAKHCGSSQPTPHGGELVALFSTHGCNHGRLCEAHYQRYVEVVLPYNFEAQKGLCPSCGQFFSAHDFQRVVRA